MMDEELVYIIALSMVPQVGPITAKELIKSIGSAEEVIKSNERTLLRVAGVGQHISKQIRSKNYLQRAEQEFNFIQKNNIRAITYLDAEYPIRLKQCVDSPLILYIKGNSNLENRYVISIVGSRMATEYGKGICRDFIQGIKELNPIVVSGLAYGIDITAHKESLTAGLDTIAVVGHGLDRIYPFTHRSVAQEIIQQGALVSEFFSEVKPDRENFPARNRIIAGMSDAVIVVEAREQGGALITAEIANHYNRDVFAFPGRIHDLQSKGCLSLIKNNLAQLISSSDEFRAQMGWNYSEKKAIQKSLFIDLNEEERKIIEMLITSNKDIHLDHLMQQLNWRNSKLNEVLLHLEIKGLVKCLPGKSYCLC